MPHQCTGCGHTFEDGSKKMLSGCPNCGGNTFQFRPSKTASDRASVDGSSTDRASVDGSSTDGHSVEDTSSSPESGSPESDSPESDSPESSPPDRTSSSVAETVGRATTQLRDLVSSNPDPPSNTDRSGSPTDLADPDPDAEWPDGWSNDPHGRTANTAKNDDIIDADARRDANQTTDRGEDLAQTSARSDVVSPKELDDRSMDTAVDAADPTSTTSADRSDPASSPPTDGADPASSPPTDGADPASSPPTDGAELASGSHSTETPRSSADGEVVSEPTGDDPDLADLREQLNDQFESIKILEPGQYELNLMELYDREEYIIALQENGRYVIQVPEQWIGEDPDDR
jgi:predicted  nucleic acid-binding Zn-ribbon protein